MNSKNAVLGLSVVVLVGGLASQGTAATGTFIPNNTPKYVATAQNLGAEDPTKIIDAGWDNVTGVGTPNAKAFADSFHP